MSFSGVEPPCAPDDDELVVKSSRVPQEVLDRLLSEGLTIGDERLTLAHHALSFLGRAVALCGFAGGSMTLLREDVAPRRRGADIRYSGFSYTLTLDDGSAISHEGLSYGQKRVLSFLYHLALNNDVVVADELASGLQGDWTRACIQEIGARQAFLASQNPILLDSLPFESAEQVRQSFVLCRLERREGGSVMAWKNLDADAAEEIFRSYKTRALEVSEILRTQGLW